MREILRRYWVALVLVAILVGAFVVYPWLMDAVEPSPPDVPPGTSTTRTVPSASSYTSPKWRIPQDGKLRRRPAAEIVRSGIQEPATPPRSSPAVVANNAPTARLYPGFVRACEHARAFTVFGDERLAGLPIRNSHAQCDPPVKVVNGRLAPPKRLNFTLYSYGRCEGAGDETGCAYELQVYSTPSCEAAHNLYHVLTGPPGERGLSHRHTEIRGVPAALFDSGRRIELYTKRTTINIVAATAAVARRAAREIQPAPDAYAASETRGERLPRPAAAAATDRRTPVPCAT